MKKIGYSDFIRICQIGSVATWCDWLLLREDGVYIKKPDDGIELTPEERAVLTGHPTGNLNEPALSFPCDVSTLMDFLEKQAIGVDIDDEYLRSVDYQESNDTCSVGGAICISVAHSDALLNVETILRRIADTRYPHALNAEVDPQALELCKHAHMMRLRDGIREALRIGCLSARYSDGIKYSAPPLGETFDGVYVSRPELEGFSTDEWMVKFVDAPTENNEASNWRQQIRDAATQWCKERQNEGKPKATKLAIAEEMAIWCRNNDIETGTGKKPDTEYIRRHVLNRWNHP